MHKLPLTTPPPPQLGEAVRHRQAWLKPALILGAIGTIALGASLPETLSVQAKLALFAFGTAAVLWATTKFEAGYVALGAVLLLVVSGGIEQEKLFTTLQSQVIWLMIGAFIVGAAAEQSGLAKRLATLTARRIKSVRGMMWLSAAILVPLTFLIPSTSGRATVMLPLFQSLTGNVARPAVTRALAILIPVVILVSTIASMTGAGSHLIVVDLLSETAKADVSFLQWMAWGAPFAIVATIISVWTINRLFLTREELSHPIKVDDEELAPMSSAEKQVAFIFVAMVSLWMTGSVHGLHIASVSVLGAFLICMPKIGAISWKQGLKGVSWPLVIFVGAALVLGEALIETGAAQWIVNNLFQWAGLGAGATPWAIILGLSAIALTSHLYMTSHAARTAALVPPMLYMALQSDLNPIAIAFLATVGINFCITLPVSSKALLVFQEMDKEGRMPADLLRLSAVLMPAHLILMVLFYYGYWQHVGLSL